MFQIVFARLVIFETFPKINPLISIPSCVITYMVVPCFNEFPYLLVVPVGKQMFLIGYDSIDDIVKGLTHYLGNKTEFNVSTKGLFSKC